MPKRKSNDDDNIEKEPPKPLQLPAPKKIKFETLPEVHSIKDLIKIGETSKFYKNIDVTVLWDILPHLIELDNMIGMKSVKDSMFYQILYYLQGMHLRNKDGDYLHCIITGKPGTGKTTIAKIIAKIYQDIGILAKNSKFKLAHREDFVGQYLGETANKTKKLLNSCLGGVLFVDEIYALSAGQKDKDSYAKEAIDTITAFLSEHKNDFVFIGAGYKEQVEKCFFGMNEGLRRRITWIHNITEYSLEDLTDIFYKMVKETNWIIDIDKKVFIKALSENKEITKDAGGSMENLLTKIKLVHSRRVFGKEKDCKFKITIEDIYNAMDLLKKNDLEKKRDVVYDYYT